ncbi:MULTISPECIES: DUF6705 family protein [Chryseobacterium]|uniref:DUF6705 domain-containing protein n=1 Tax=Chryseobacterium taihuense TaxID=1141221 RepID=A0A4U8WKZ6_9FLAO|nr:MULTISPECIES: DUF6705 family protein [Chryseobacterium]QQV03225.1 hypothetical protein I6I61_02365 [Chryseobacterium sp. FDAARGOS 1104]VFB03468.1 Uncharacterised protein [Chryseobacterium taihuense]
MNKLILIIITIFSISCKSQTNIVDKVNVCNSHPFNTTDGSLYKKDISNLYGPFLGTWKWTSGNREMTLVLLKQTKHHYNMSGNDNFYADRMIGYYIYKENGNVIIDTSNEDLTKDYGLTVNFNILCDGNISTAFFEDPPKKKTYNVLLKKISTTQMKFTASMDENSIILPKNGTVIIPGGTSFPPEMIFTKQ